MRKTTDTGRAILAKNKRLLFVRKEVGRASQSESEIEVTGDETSSNVAVPFLSCSRRFSAYLKHKIPYTAKETGKQVQRKRSRWQNLLYLSK